MARKITMKQTSECAGAHIPFDCSSLYGRGSKEEGYAVFSYTSNYPIYVYTDKQWYVNSDPSPSATTTRHMKASEPVGKRFLEPKTTAELYKMTKALGLSV